LHPLHNPSLLKQIPNIHSSNIPPNPIHHHSHIFQKVLANAFLLFIRSADKYQFHQYFYNFTLMKSFLFAVYSRIFLRREGFR
ncbi:hypothetical protein CWN75_17465, partial [Klebsiella pneumoniae]